MQRAIVIGAGVGGMAAAIRLAVSGFDVVVYESNPEPGGKLTHFTQQGFQFDAGPSLFTQPHILEELFVLAGERMSDYLQYDSVPYACHYFYEDGTDIRASADPVLLAAELEAKTGEPPEHVQRYLKESAQLYQTVGTIFLDHSLHKPATFSKVPWLKLAGTLRRSHLFGTMHERNARSFRSEKIVQLFNRFATYNGSTPYRAPGMLTLIPHLEHNEGVFYPHGGMISITRALYQLAIRKGVQFCFNQPVSRIIHTRNGVAGVVVNGVNQPAHVVVSNADAYFTYKHLLQDERKAQKIGRQERSSSAMVFYWGIGKEFPQLDLHNIFFAKDYAAEFDHLFRLKKIYQDPTVYVNITSKCEPGIQAPAGMENWFVMVNAPAVTNQDWESYRAIYRRAILDKLSRLLGQSIEPLIRTEAVLDPLAIAAKTSSFRGALYGTSSNSKLAAFLRHPNFAAQIPGLYFVGGTVHPGGGIPLCLRSAAIAAGMIIQQKGRRKHA